MPLLKYICSFIVIIIILDSSPLDKYGTTTNSNNYNYKNSHKSTTDHVYFVANLR